MSMEVCWITAQTIIVGWRIWLYFFQKVSIAIPAGKINSWWLVLLAGGFRYKRIQSSQSFASKRNYPLTQYVSYPRINGYRELLDPIMGITHVVDLTIAYDDSEDTPSMLDILRGRNLTSIHFHYRVYPVNECPNIRTENWLYERWQMKEAMLNNHYKAIKINDEQSSNSVAALTTDNEGDCANKFHKELNNGGVGENSLDCGGHHSNQRDNNNLPASNPAATTTNYPFKSHHQFASLHFNLDEGRPIKFSYFKVVLIHLFYILVNVFVYQICALIFWRLNKTSKLRNKKKQRSTLVCTSSLSLMGLNPSRSVILVAFWKFSIVKSSTRKMAHSRSSHYVNF